MIPVIHTQLQLPQQRREELRHLDAFALQPFPVPVLHGPAAHAVKQHTDFHALARLLDQDFLDGLPEFVISYNIILNMDVTPCLTHLIDQRTEFLVSVRIDPDVIIVRQDRLSGLQIIKDQIFKTGHLRIGKLQPFMIDRFFLTPYRVFELTFDLFRLEHPAFMEILPDDQVQDESQYWYKIQQKQPCPYRLRRPSLKEHNDQCQKDVNNDNIVHDKIIDCHHSVPNHFCHSINSFSITVYPFPPAKVNPKPPKNLPGSAA